jgi:hypothetical protein
MLVQQGEVKSWCLVLSGADWVVSLGVLSASSFWWLLYGGFLLLGVIFVAFVCSSILFVAEYSWYSSFVFCYVVNLSYIIYIFLR